MKPPRINPDAYRRTIEQRGRDRRRALLDGCAMWAALLAFWICGLLLVVPS